MALILAIMLIEFKWNIFEHPKALSFGYVLVDSVELHNKEMKGGQTERGGQTNWPLDFPRALLSAAAEKAKVCTIGGSTP